MPAKLNFFKTSASLRLVSSQTVSTSTGISGCYQPHRQTAMPGQKSIYETFLPRTQSPGWSVPYLMHPLDKASLGRGIPWTMLHWCVPWTVGPLDYASITSGSRNIGTDCPYNREGLLGLQRGAALTIHFGLGWEILVLIGTYPSGNLLSKGCVVQGTQFPRNWTDIYCLGTHRSGTLWNVIVILTLFSRCYPELVLPRRPGLCGQFR